MQHCKLEQLNVKQIEIRWFECLLHSLAKTNIKQFKSTALITSGNECTNECEMRRPNVSTLCTVQAKSSGLNTVTSQVVYTLRSFVISSRRVGVASFGVNIFLNVELSICSTKQLLRPFPRVPYEYVLSRTSQNTPACGRRVPLRCTRQSIFTWHTRKLITIV